MGWSSKTQPTPANIRKRITAAQDAIGGAMDLIKKNDRMGKRELVPLNNAYSWLQDAQRRLQPKRKVTGKAVRLSDIFDNPRGWMS